ncbi:hypothetical protein PGTUg99_001099 [Puccinia graminis f. sp. tritici]|uniref:Uncharacterized protein n=1 Tax=Puccinia graminis f. sp. tritici TaxID=56615 RepID=A0A5B0R4T5_PUCGR|nr:hypothetical protein PGTUg99_001099 [Puccinia graminis f. sp. tritici]
MTRLKVGSTRAARWAVPTPSAIPPPRVLALESQILSDQARGQPAKSPEAHLYIGPRGQPNLQTGSGRAVNFLNATRPDPPGNVQALGPARPIIILTHNGHPKIMNFGFFKCMSLGGKKLANPLVWFFNSIKNLKRYKQKLKMLTSFLAILLMNNYG